MPAVAHTVRAYLAFARNLLRESRLVNYHPLGIGKC